MKQHDIRKKVLKHCAALLAAALVLAGCAPSGSIKIKIKDINTYHSTNERTCKAVEEYVKSHAKLAVFYSTTGNKGYYCSPSPQRFYINLGNGSDIITISEHDDNTFDTHFTLNQGDSFTYVKDGITKNANVSTEQSIAITKDGILNEAETISLFAGGTIFYLDYDQANNLFLSRNFREWNEEIRFVADLQTKLVAFVHRLQDNLLHDEEALQIAVDLTKIIQNTADLTSNDITNVKTINDIEFDHIYPLMHGITEPGVHHYAVIPDYYTVEKNGKYGLINNNGLLVADMIFDDNLHMGVINEIVPHNTEYANIPYTTFFFGGGHGTNKKELYWDQSQNQAMIMSYGHDGPGIYYDYRIQTESFASFPVLPYKLVAECKYHEESFCELQMISKQFGFMDNAGNLITDPQFDEVFVTNTPLLAVQKDGLWGYVDHKGQQVVDFLYQGIIPSGDFYYPYPPIRNMLIVKDANDKFGVLNMQGKTIVPFEYDLISPYFNDQIILQKDGKWTAKKVK